MYQHVLGILLANGLVASPGDLATLLILQLKFGKVLKGLNLTIIVGIAHLNIELDAQAVVQLTNQFDSSNLLKPLLFKFRVQEFTREDFL